MLAQKKINQADDSPLNSSYALRLELSDGSYAFHRVGFKKRQWKLPELRTFA
jgi:hypothetical protein